MPQTVDPSQGTLLVDAFFDGNRAKARRTASHVCCLIRDRLANLSQQNRPREPSGTGGQFPRIDIALSQL
jgi:hypothetical protein